MVIGVSIKCKAPKVVFCTHLLTSGKSTTQMVGLARNMLMRTQSSDAYIRYQGQMC